MVNITRLRHLRDLLMREAPCPGTHLPAGNDEFVMIPIPLRDIVTFMGDLEDAITAEQEARSQHSMNRASGITLTIRAHDAAELRTYLADMCPLGEHYHSNGVIKRHERHATDHASHAPARQGDPRSSCEADDEGG